MAQWVGYDRDSPHGHWVCWPEKHSITIEQDIKLTTDTLIVYTPPEHATTQPATSLSQPSGMPQSTAENHASCRHTRDPRAGQHTKQHHRGATWVGCHQRQCEHAEMDDEPPPSPLTLLSHTPSPHQQPPAPKKPKATTMLPVWQSMHAMKPALHPCASLSMQRGFFLPLVPLPLMLL
jgi:hypothetical protein